MDSQFRNWITIFADQIKTGLFLNSLKIAKQIVT